MELVGNLRPLQHDNTSPVSYFFRTGQDRAQLNDLVGETIWIKFKGEINCIHCGRRVKKTYNSGSCFPCFRDLAENDLCIVKPELCHFDKGTCRDEAFGAAHCMQPHIVYLALSSEVKVGITWKANMLKRWVDQGAIQGLPIAEVPSRKLAGQIEVELAQHISDKTNWRRMLKSEIAKRDLRKVREELFDTVPDQFRQYLLVDGEIHSISYPQVSIPEKITAWNLDKHQEVSGKLIGIKGQYLILDTGVLNVRKFSGYKVALVV
ncbi:Protein of unknown function [Marininema mesophilum]|uniref:DUF2797 domain-containing protein n=1 Tax=Marininema mesophilum TaxID=1048340 RepID=A0A1H2YZJ4_9BACL|nr:DUF2797 domain-containing protein [Marininema mesophilum]SDX10526.1 Protein of unknown function [Marininema mesophilum]